jgi:hypothetical protein
MYDSIIFTDLTDNIVASKPIGAYKCAQVLRENNYSCLVVDNFHFFDQEELLKLLDLTFSGQTKFVGFSNTFFLNSDVEKNPDGSTPPYTNLSNGVMFPQGKRVEDLIINELKKRNPNVKIVVGGAKTKLNEQNKNIDYVCLGYSEASILNLMNHLTNGEELRHAVKNVWGRIIIDDRKAESYDFVNGNMNWLPTDVVNQTVLPMEVARGCIFRCKFCAFPMNGKQQLDFVRNESNLIYEMEKNYEEYGIYRYIIVDDTFNDNDHKLDLLLHGIKRLKFQPEFWAYTRLDLISRNAEVNFQKLYDIGLRATFFGIETLHEPTGKIIGKGYNRRKQIEAVQHIRAKYGDQVSMHGAFITGLPEETEESCAKTNDLLISQELPLHSWYWNGLRITKNDILPWNSEIGLDYKKFGYNEIPNDIPADHIEWDNGFTTSLRSAKLASDLNRMSEESGVLKMRNIFSWAILPLGYDRQKMINMPYTAIDFHDIETRKLKFVEDYKRKLFGML